MSESPRRLDAALVALGLVSGREKAKELIAAGLVTVNNAVVTKPARVITDEDNIVLTATLHRYVGRGGDKLEKILSTTAIEPHNRICIDIGASTGGFTDCLLQNGAAYVYALDVGHDQLHPRLREDIRVANMEGTDIRRTDAILTAMGEKRPSFGVIDVSFISLISIWSAVEAIMTSDATMVCLIKPQFEAGRAAIGKNGVVKDQKVHIAVLQSLLQFWKKAGWCVTHLTYSPITGGEGNIEYLAVLERSVDKPFWSGPVKDLVNEAHRALRK